MQTKFCKYAIQAPQARRLQAQAPQRRRPSARPVAQIALQLQALAIHALQPMLSWAMELAGFRTARGPSG
jgi:hypothetical protein